MNTPICDFVKNYISQNKLRLHMPGHKGCGLLGFEEWDITEITGADSLYQADGIINQSEENASFLFGSNTFYSTEGSSHCIRAMLYLALQKSGGNRLIAAGRNAHKTFLTAAALLDLEIDWLMGENGNYLSSNITPEYLENYLKNKDNLPFAIYLTSPDYLGNILDIEKISEVCRKYRVMLLVDNAHGSYLKFLPHSLHPIDLGADICCDSAHKTLPALTGAAYLHISNRLDGYFKENAKSALALFGSTSPSYLILQSLDALNKYLYEYPSSLKSFTQKLDELKEKLVDKGFSLVGNETLKITVSTKPYGYEGQEFAEILNNFGIVAEFFDPDYLTLMFTPEIGEEGLNKLLNVMSKIPKKSPIIAPPKAFCLPEKRLSARQATLRECEWIDVKAAGGRISASPTVGCPPAIPIIVCGEVIDENIVKYFEYYGISKCLVVK